MGVSGSSSSPAKLTCYQQTHGCIGQASLMVPCHACLRSGACHWCSNYGGNEPPSALHAQVHGVLKHQRCVDSSCAVSDATYVKPTFTASPLVFHASTSLCLAASSAADWVWSINCHQRLRNVRLHVTNTLAEGGVSARPSLHPLLAWHDKASASELKALARDVNQGLC